MSVVGRELLEEVTTYRDPSWYCRPTVAGVGIPANPRGTICARDALNETSVSICRFGKLMAFMRCEARGVNLAYPKMRVLPTSGIRAQVLAPECEDVDRAEEIVLRDDGVAPDRGYPKAAVLPDGSVLVAYGMNDSEGTAFVAETIVRETEERLPWLRRRSALD